MRFVQRFLLAVGCVLAVSACGDTQVSGMSQTQNFDVGPSGASTCPGALYAEASEGLAECSHAPQSCVSESGATMIVCECSAGSNGHNVWECHDAHNGSPDGG
jgi:hypothetical protein